MSRLTLKQRMIRSIANRKGEVVLRRDFETMGSTSQITRAIKELVADGKLIKIGYGLYAKTKTNSLTGLPSPRKTLAEIAQEALTRLNVDVDLGEAQRDYAEGKTTQIPMQTTFNTGCRRITRKITIGKRTVRYENNYKSRV